MVAKEIKSRLDNGSKLVVQYNSYIMPDYYMDSLSAENKLTKKQFDKFKAICKNSDESQQGSCIRDSMPHMHYYWL